MKSMICKTELPFDEDMHIDAVGGQFIPPSPSLRQFDNSFLNTASLSKTPTNQHDPSLPSRPSPSFHYVRTSKSSGSSSASKKTGQSIVEERRRAAMAIYQSMDLVDTPNEEHLEYHERHLYDRATSRIKSSIDHSTAVSESVSSQSSTENKPLERKSPRNKVASALSTSTNSDMTPRASFKYQNTVNDTTLSSISSNQILQDNDSPNLSSSKLAKSSDSSQRKSSTAMVSSPSSSLPQVKKKGFLRNMLGGSRNKSSSSPITNKASSPLTSPDSSTPTNSSLTGTKMSRRGVGATHHLKKRDQDVKLGMPLDAKPGSSYKSTPHSAEIVPRTPQKTSDSQFQEAAAFPLDDSSDDLQRSEDRDEGTAFHKADNSADDSNIFDAFTNTTSNPLISDLRFPDDISILTDPSFILESPLRAQNSKKMDPIGEDEGSTSGDPHGVYWDGSDFISAPSTSITSSINEEKNFAGSSRPLQVDPFADPFYITESSSSSLDYPANFNRYDPESVLTPSRIEQIHAQESSTAMSNKVQSATHHLPPPPPPPPPPPRTSKSTKLDPFEVRYLPQTYLPSKNIASSGQTRATSQTTRKESMNERTLDSHDIQELRQAARRSLISEDESISEPSVQSSTLTPIQSSKVYDKYAHVASAVPSSFLIMSSTSSMTTEDHNSSIASPVKVTAPNIVTKSPPIHSEAEQFLRKRRMRSSMNELKSQDRILPPLEDDHSTISGRNSPTQSFFTIQHESPSSPSNVSKEFEFLNSKSPLKSALVLGSKNKTDGNLENKTKRIPNVKALIHENERAEHLPKLQNPDELERFDIEKKSGGYPVSTRKALDLIRNSKNHVRRPSTGSKPEPIVPTSKSAKTHALDLIRKKDVRLQRPKSIVSNTYHSGLTEAVNKAADKKHPHRNKSLVSTIETLVPPRAPTQLNFSKFSKKGRKPYYNRNANGDFSKSVNLRQKIKNPLALRKSNPPTKEKPSNGYIKVRRMLIEPHVVEIGMAEMYRKRRKLIEWGIIIPRKIHTVKVPKSVNTVDESTMDPIQRAGYRLLCKAAVPIQSSVRRFLAQKEALDRMWGLIELQAYFRRWRCEAYRFAHKWAACKIQSAFRGWQTRQKLDEAIFASVEIQRIVRGYLATTQVYDRFYSLITIQCAVRGWLGRVKARRQLGIIIVLQSIVRRYLAKLTVQKRIRAATIIQSAYRGYSALLHFQFDIVDIIIVQSIIRRWKALKMASILKIERDQAAATRIQKVWRGFQSYSDFVFSLADILTTQRVARGWLARRKANFMKRIKSATIIQSQWRRYKAQIGSLYKLVHLIIVQSIIRRRLAIRRVRQLRIENWAAETIQSQWRLRRWMAEKKCHEAATMIQSAWRRFWIYSQYLIISFEIIRMQSFYRGHRARKLASLQMGCAIIIQSSMRRCLAIRVAQQLKVIRVLVSANSECLRENIASKRIQRQWRGYKRRKKELYAAAVIHRFFAMVKLEVDREICRQRDKKAKKKKRRSREKVETEEKMLERAWLNVVEIDPYGKKGKSFPLGKISESGSDASRSVPPRVSKSRQMERERQKPLLTGKAVDVRPFDEMSEVTGASVFNAPARVNTLSRKEMSDDLSLEEAWIDTEILQVKRRRESEEDYLQRHGLQHHTAFQIRDSRPYAPIPHLMRGQRMDAIPPKLNHSTPLQASLVRRQAINTHHVSGMYQPLSAHPPNTFHQMVALQRHDIPPPAPHLVLAHGNSMHAPVSHSNNHFEGYRNRGPSHHPLQSHVNTSRYSDPGYFQGGEPLRTNLGGYARHPRSESPSGSQGYVDYPKPKDRSGYYRG